MRANQEHLLLHLLLLQLLAATSVSGVLGDVASPGTQTTPQPGRVPLSADNTTARRAQLAWWSTRRVVSLLTLWLVMAALAGFAGASAPGTPNQLNSLGVLYELVC